MANPGLTKTYNAEAVINPYTIAKFGANDFGVLPAASSSDQLIGVSGNFTVSSGARVDVYHKGIAYVKLGGTVARQLGHFRCERQRHCSCTGSGRKR